MPPLMLRFLTMLAPVLMLPLAVSASSIFLSRPAVAQSETAIITPIAFEGRLGPNSQIVADDGSHYNTHNFEGQAGQVVLIDMESN